MIFKSASSADLSLLMHVNDYNSLSVFFFSQTSVFQYYTFLRPSIITMFHFVTSAVSDLYILGFHVKNT